MVKLESNGDALKTVFASALFELNTLRVSKHLEGLERSQGPCQRVGIHLA